MVSRFTKVAFWGLPGMRHKRPVKVSYNAAWARLLQRQDAS